MIGVREESNLIVLDYVYPVVLAPFVEKIVLSLIVLSWCLVSNDLHVIRYNIPFSLTVFDLSARLTRIDHPSFIYSSLFVLLLFMLLVIFY